MMTIPPRMTSHATPVLYAVRPEEELKMQNGIPMVSERKNGRMKKRWSASYRSSRGKVSPGMMDTRDVGLPIALS